MVDVVPFRAIRPQDTLASEVIAPPYDVLSEAEARAIANNPKSFVRITRSEVDLPEGSDSHSRAAYEKARDNLQAFIKEGTLIQDDEPCYYFYAQKMGEHEQVGILAGTSAEEYDKGIIKKHEFTRPDKEDDRTEHMDVINAQVGLVFLTYRRSNAIDELTQKVIAQAPLWTVTTEDDVEHRFWRADTAHNEAIRKAFAEVGALYIADGHHRSAAGSRINKKHKSSQSAHFLAGIFPDNALLVMAYNRVVHTLNGLSEGDFLAKLGEKFDIESGPNKPVKRGDFSMYFQKTWHTLRAKPGVVDEADPVKRLDAAVLQDHVLAPLLGIDDPRTSKDISFVGGIRGPEALEEAVHAGHAVAFHLFPTPLDQLFAVADAGQVMPPKSTWFEPKLREGVVVRPL